MLTKNLRILVVDNNDLRAAIIEAGLRENGHAHVTRISGTDHLLGQIEAANPAVIIMDLESPNRDMLEYALAVSRSVHRPIAMFVDKTDAAMTEAAIDAGVSAYVVDGLKKERIIPILDMAISRFNAIERMRRELDEAKSQLSDRRVIDRAKNLLMQAHGLDENAAYSLLRKTAMNQSRKIVHVADGLLMAAELLPERKNK